MTNAVGLVWGVFWNVVGGCPPVMAAVRSQRDRSPCTNPHQKTQRVRHQLIGYDEQHQLLGSMQHWLMPWVGARHTTVQATPNVYAHGRVQVVYLLFSKNPSNTFVSPCNLRALNWFQI